MKLSTRLRSAALIVVTYVTTVVGAAFALATAAYGWRLVTTDPPVRGKDWLWALVSLLVTIAAFWIRSRSLIKRQEIEKNDTSDLVRR